MSLLLATLVALAGVLQLAEPERLAGLPPGAPVRLLPTPQGVLLGSDAGLYRLGASGWQLVLTRGGVRDLARGPHETIIATGAGLFAWADDSDVPLPLGLGAGARVAAVAVAADGRILAGSAVGLFSRAPGAGVFRRELGLPAGAVIGVRTVGEQVWVAMRGTLWLAQSGGAFAPRLRRLEEGWWELRGAIALHDDVLLVVPKGLWRIPGDGGEAEALSLGAGDVRAAVSAGEFAVVASERGLLPLRGVPDARAAAAAISRDAFDVAREADRLLVVSARGVESIALRPAPGPALAVDPPGVAPAELARLHAAVLGYQGLRPAAIDRVDELARRAALLPELKLGLVVDRDRDRDRDFDQVVSSGVLHNLKDHRRQRNDELALSLQLTWDLNEHRDPGRAIAVSRERRELIELRDQVLERVNRLYFERARVLSRLSAASAPDAPDLEIRARELTAQLDAWTGGLFTRLVKTSPRHSGSPP